MNNEKIENILKNLGIEKVPEDIQKIAKDASDNFSKQLSLSQKHKQHYLLEFLMKSNLTKFAIAATIIIVIIFSLNHFGNSGIAWADVLNNVETAKTVAFRLESESQNQIGTEFWEKGEVKIKGYYQLFNEHESKYWR